MVPKERMCAPINNNNNDKCTVCMRQRVDIYVKHRGDMCLASLNDFHDSFYTYH